MKHLGWIVAVVLAVSLAFTLGLKVQDQPDAAPAAPAVITIPPTPAPPVDFSDGYCSPSLPTDPDC